MFELCQIANCAVLRIVCVCGSCPCGRARTEAVGHESVGATVFHRYILDGVSVQDSGIRFCKRVWSRQFRRRSLEGGFLHKFSVSLSLFVRSSVIPYAVRSVRWWYVDVIAHEGFQTQRHYKRLGREAGPAFLPMVQGRH